MSKSSSFLFNTIAPVYSLFFNYQRERFFQLFEEAEPELALEEFNTVLDVGCGTGALCSVLLDSGLTVTGIDPAEKMLQYARKRKATQGVTFLQGNALEGLPFDDGSFDLVMASFVAHGMPQPERKKLYAEMSRIAGKKVIIYDYNENRALLTSVIEWLERGDYFHFIRHAEHEMKECMSEMEKCFSRVEVVDAGERSSLYICTPSNR